MLSNLKINLSKKANANAINSRFSEADKDRLFYKKGIRSSQVQGSLISTKLY